MSKSQLTSRYSAKGTSWDVHTAKIQISLRIHRVWSESYFAFWRTVVPLATHRAPIEDSDQPAQMRRLIWVFDWRTCKLVPFAKQLFIWSVFINGVMAHRVGTHIFFFKRRLGPSIYRSPKKKISGISNIPKIFEILATLKNIRLSVPWP